MGGRGTFASGKNVAYQYESVGTIRGVKVLEKINKKSSTALPEEAHSSNAYILIGKDGEIRQYREFNEDHTAKFDIDYLPEKNIDRHNKVLHIHEYTGGVRQPPRRLTVEEYVKYGKYFNVNLLRR